MLFYQDLEEIIFNRHQIIDADELIVLSGYVGPNPVKRLENLPLKSLVVYGMYGSDGIGERLNNSLVNLNDTIENTSIIYSTIPVHSKCYIWKKENVIKHVLIGSANFSTNGLNTPFREVLAETTFDTYYVLKQYLDKILENCIDCHDAITKKRFISGNELILQEDDKEILDPNYCKMTLLDPRTGETPDASGINWGQSGRSHTNRNDAYIAIRSNYIKNYPLLFPPKQEFPTREDPRGRRRNNDSIEIIWDDGTTMEGLLEGTIPIDGKNYPKQISSFPNKKILGQYIRRRLGVPDEGKINKKDLERYGRDYITVSLQGEGIYYFDFSV